MTYPSVCKEHLLSGYAVLISIPCFSRRAALVLVCITSDVQAAGIAAKMVIPEFPKLFWRPFHTISVKCLKLPRPNQQTPTMPSTQPCADTTITLLFAHLVDTIDALAAWTDIVADPVRLIYVTDQSTILYISPGHPQSVHISVLFIRSCLCAGACGAARYVRAV